MDDDVLRQLETTPEMIYDSNEDYQGDYEGEWKPTLIQNPEYLRLQSLTRKNPAYKGRWPPKIRNPNFGGGKTTGKFNEDIGVVAVLVKTQTPGILIDDINFETIDLT